MCGIAGIFNYKNNNSVVEQEELLRCREAMVTRGPDGAGIWVSHSRRAGLANRRLSIIDLSDAGNQPIATEDGSIRVVFNGEIYNYRALRNGLEKKGYRFRSNSDTEVLCYLYVDRGLEMVHDLRGMYAFALWDERRRGLLLARDPFGIKPLYYADDGSAIRFASQVKALLKGGRIDLTPEPAGHVGFFLWGCVPEPYTLYKGIRALPAGSTLWIDEDGRHKLGSFCSVSDELTKAEQIDPKIEREEVRERLRAALVESVQHHLIADVPVGVFLSSGLDSTTLLALSSEAIPEHLRTITLGFNEYHGTESDEAPLAAKVAGLYGTSHQTRWVSREDFRSDLDRLLATMDQPSIDGVNTYFVSKVTAETGLKVALSGLGGDELFGSYPSFSDVPKIVRVLTPARTVTRAAP
jgi:asparagine synthase (glutamine-hydrolysing)